MTTLVLLSGGVDSTAALLWAIARDNECRAVGFDYGQPAATAERAASMWVCARAGVPFDHFVLADAVHGYGSLWALDYDSPRGAHMPGRNAILLSCAAAHAERLELRRALLVVGCNQDDCVHLDCGGAFLARMGQALYESTRAVGGIEQPWGGHSKARVVAWLERQHPGYLELTTSCYRGTDCGTCAACVSRKAAIDAPALLAALGAAK
jgi:7-cyano-7-deazaguanine synthase